MRSLEPLCEKISRLGRHQGLALTPATFARWLALFGETLTEYLPIELAARWLQMAEAIAANLQRHTLDQPKHSCAKPLI